MTTQVEPALKFLKLGTRYFKVQAEIAEELQNEVDSMLVLANMLGFKVMYRWNNESVMYVNFNRDRLHAKIMFTRSNYALIRIGVPIALGFPNFNSMYSLYDESDDFIKRVRLFRDLLASVN